MSAKKYLETGKQYLKNVINYIDKINYADYVKKYDNYSYIPTYVDAYGSLKVKENLLHDELLSLMGEYLQGLRPLGAGWLENGGYALDYEYIGIVDERTPRMVSRYITNAIMSKYSLLYIPPLGMDSYLLCDAVSQARANIVTVYYKGSNLSGIHILQLREKLKL